MSADHADFSAPDQQRQGGFEQLAQLIVEGCLIDHHHALLTAQVGGSAGQRHDAVAAIGKFDRERLDVLIVAVVFPQPFLDSAGGVVEHTRPHAACLDVFNGHVLVIADVINVHAPGGLAGGGDQHVISGLSPGQARTP